MTPLLLLLCALAPAQEAADEPATAEEPAEVPATVAIAAGPMQFRSERVFEMPPLALDRCAATAPPVPSAAEEPRDGQLLLELRFKRGELSVVTVARVDPGLDWLTPCLQRELAAARWPVLKGRAELPVTVTHPEPPESP